MTKKDTGHTVWMCKLVSAFIHIQQKRFSNDEACTLLHTFVQVTRQTKKSNIKTHTKKKKKKKMS